MGGSDSDSDSTVSLMGDKGGHHAFTAPLLGGLVLGGAPTEVLKAGRSWAYAMGVAFQGLDDIVDLVGDPSLTGKEGFQDFRAGRLGLPLLLLRQRCTEEEWAEVQHSFGGGTGATFGIPERRFIHDLLQKYGIVRMALNLVHQKIDEAEGAVVSMPDGLFHQGLTTFSTGLRAAVTDAAKAAEVDDL